MKRCFIAIKIPADNSIQTFYQHLRKEFEASGINWVKPENMHLTLVFLGEISDKQIEAAMGVLNETKLKYAPFHCELKGFGSFGPIQNPSVLWIGINSSPVLNEIKQDLDAGLKITGYKQEGRAFHPHLTLGRIKLFKNQAELHRLIGRYSDHSFLEFTGSSLTLFESKLSALGPVYSVLRDFPLMG
jgi:2'-5' RNA ligase